MNLKSSFNIQNLTILAIIIIAAFLRLYRISDYMTFLGDEGRDVLVAKGILEGHLTLLGPRASAGDFFLGPIYYYFMAPFLWLFHFDPVGPAVMIALIGVATVFLIYKIAKEFFGFKTAIFASALYAVSPLVIHYSSSSWNPNPMPFVSLLTLYLTYHAVQKPSVKRFIVIGFLLGIALQLHYLAVFLITIVAAFILFARISLDNVAIWEKILKYYLQTFVGFLIGLSPFIAFEIRHGFPNIKTIIGFIFTNTFHSSYGNSVSFINIIKDVFFRLFGRLALRFPPPDQIQAHFFTDSKLFIWDFIVVALGIVSVLSIFLTKKKLIKILFEIWIFLGVILFGFYKKPIYDYYFGFMFPLPFILIGNFISQIYDLGKGKKLKMFLKIIALLVFISILIFNLYGNPFRFQPNRQKDQVKQISEFVISKTDNKPFNFALITNGNSDYAYRYYFEILDHPDTRMENLINDPKRTTVTSKLMIICEDTSCKPLGYPMFEVSNFGRAVIAGEWDVSVVKIFKLVHYHGK